MVRTYVVGNLNSVVRLDDHVGPWVPLSPLISPTLIGDITVKWRDVMSDPTNADKVIIVGSSGGKPLPNQSIQVSTDAGVTWTIPTGTWTTTTDYLYELWYVDTNIIWATGKDGIVVLSIDGGVSFNAVPTLVEFGNYLQTAGIHALDDQVAIVLGSPGEGVTQSELYVWKTIDGGTTWVMLSGASLPASESNNVNDIGNANGIWMSPDQQKIIVGSGYNQYISYDGGLIWDDVLEHMLRSGIHFTWFPTYDPNPQFFRHVGGSNNQVAQSIDSGLSYSLIRSTVFPLFDPAVTIRGAQFYAPYDGYYTINNDIFSTGDGADSGTLSYTDLNSLVIYEAVWTSVEVPPFDLCYELTDCAGVLNPIYTQSDLSEQVDQVITLADDTNHELQGCWLVTATNLSCPNTTLVSVYRCFTDCEECLPPPPEIVFPCPRPIDPGYNTGLCDPEVVENAKCSFVDMIYNKMIAKRYAVKFCCPPNEIDIIIQKEKIDLLLMTSEDPTPDPCNPECRSYEIEIDPEDSAVTTYVDCLGKPQTTVTKIGDNGLLPTVVRFCAFNTTPPVSIVTHPDTTTNTYILEEGDVC